MKIAVSATGQDIEANVDPRFGRAQYFLIVDTETMQAEAVSNDNAMGGGGVGIASAQLVANKGAEVVLTGNCGPNAFSALAQVGVQVIIGVSGKIKDAVEAYKAGKYQAAPQANVAEHSGSPQGGGTQAMNQQMGGGMGRGGGRGMGGGGGRGRGMGR
ncbi:MAG: NifB/NifX family molybdenum-iron cluster-binding protein [Chloroflexi bacterium]|jgi:predicted Fe-Mo cluster-binding NifX family protein|nr:NifB/NifX family molybdenum-iron cluster-binding protein [Chloroflexota bacterium]MBT7080497.1 NifB/NifX family molybdenum-iron cluster-binding protein [Chloroflexota bacterium]MBT7288936.1 NifB/NifX family molybdenum-iron cluster-binding protein [Chloroflexota bacterium]